MSCIFESNLRNNPIHNRHILREEYGDRPFIMPEDPTDGKPEEMEGAEFADDGMPESHVYEVFYDKSVPVDEFPEDFQIEAGTDEEAFSQILDRWEEEGAFPIQDVTKDGMTVKDEFDEFSSTSTEGEFNEPSTEESPAEEPPAQEPTENPVDELRMESCVMGSNLFGRGGYGKAILRHLVEDFGDDYYDRDDTIDPEAMSDGMGATETVGDRISHEFEDSEELINQAIDFMEDRGYDVEDPADSVDETVWQELRDALIPDGGFAPEEDPEAELNAASDYYDEHPYEVEGVDGEPANEAYELHSMLSIEGQPTYEEPEVKKEPKPKPPALTAKRNRRLRSKTRNIQLWNNKKKCFDPKYINTRFARMRDAQDAIKKIGGEA